MFVTDFTARHHDHRARLGRHDQLPGGLPPPSHHPCWAHNHKNLVGHSNGSYFGEADHDFLKWIPKRDPKFGEWLKNKNSGQEVSVLQEYGLR